MAWEWNEFTTELLMADDAGRGQRSLHLLVAGIPHGAARSPKSQATAPVYGTDGMQAGSKAPGRRCLAL
jgi:hypothetical protein